MKTDKKARPLDRPVDNTVLAAAQTAALITDSVAQVPEELARQLGITVVPLSVQIEGVPYRDGVDLNLSELYRRMREEKILPTTIAPTPVEFEQAMRGCLSSGAQAVLCITISSRLSSSYTSACLAANLLRENHPERTIEVFDSLTAAAAEGSIVLAAARRAALGDSLQAVLEAARAARGRTGLVASFETLEYLRRGGRIGKAAYMLGSLIDIKPVVTLDAEGTVAPLASARTTRRALQVMVNYVARRTKGCRRLSLTILAADAPEQAASLRELVLQRLHPAEIQDSVFTPVMGVHTGPGLIGLAYACE
jgi:DegV family protein with EDD domain